MKTIREFTNPFFNLQKGISLKSLLTRMALVFFLAIGVSPLIAQPWQQVGANINGEAAGDRSGFVSISSDGARMAVGAPFNDDNGNLSGHARIFEWNGSAWSQLGADIAGEFASDFSGTSTSLSADGGRIAIGAPHADSNVNDVGHARIFEWNGSSWVQLGTDIDGVDQFDECGWAVSISADGDRIAVGSRRAKVGGLAIGYVRIYDWNGSAWVQAGANIEGEAFLDKFGESVALSDDGSRVAIGGPDNDANGTNSGHVRVLEWNGSAWVQMGGDIDGEAANDFSGFEHTLSISSDGSRVAIGSPKNDAGASDAGHTRIFEWNGSSWAQLGTDINGLASPDLSGAGVELSDYGNRLAIGSQGAKPNGSFSGEVKIYDWDGSAWTQAGSTIEGESAFDQIGQLMSMSGDGSRLALGSQWRDANGNDAGYTRVFEFAAPPCPDNDDDGFDDATCGGDDCDDSDPNEFPGQAWYIDADNDNYGSSSTTTCERPANGKAGSEILGSGTDDCDDNDADEFPGQTWYIDADNDNYGSSSTTACERPANGKAGSEILGSGTDDCDDNDADEFPGQTWYIDADNDNYGSSSTTACERPANGKAGSEILGSGTDDCDDNDADEFPGQTWYIDADNDDYGGSSTTACERPANGKLLPELAAGSTGTDDCDDNDADEFPGQTWYIDADNDDYGGSSTTACERPANGKLLPELEAGSTGTDDCDDNDADEFPGQTWYIDADNDNYGSSSTTACERPANGKLLPELAAGSTGTDDCDDDDANKYPGNVEVCDGQDNDCNGVVDEGSICCPDGTIYVDAAAAGNNNGSSWTGAYTDLQDALNNPCPGFTEIWVATGTYKPTSSNDRTAHFTMQNGIAIYGGFAGNETMLSQRDWANNPSILSGDIGTLENSTDNSYHVIFNGSGINNTAILDGFTISHGNADGIGDQEHGGGIFNDNASPTIRFCKLINNMANKRGGGIYNKGGAPKIELCEIENNVADLGGGAANYNGSTATFFRCGFWTNTATQVGGGMANNISDVVMESCTFNYNAAPTGGGGIYNISSLPNILNTLFLANTANEGAAISILGTGSAPKITNCTFYGNDAGTTGGTIRNNTNTAPKIINCILWGNHQSSGGEEIANSPNSATVSHSIVWMASGVYPGTGNLNEDPDFVSSNDLRPKPCSPTIDAGDNSANSTTLDIAQVNRIYNNTIDMGIFESQVNIAQSNTYTGAGDGTSWNDPFNWSGLFAPDTCQDVIIPTGNSVTVPAGEEATGRTLEVRCAKKNKKDFLNL